MVLFGFIWNFFASKLKTQCIGQKTLEFFHPWWWLPVGIHMAATWIKPWFYSQIQDFWIKKNYSKNNNNHHCLFHQWEHLKCNGHGLSILCVRCLLSALTNGFAYVKFHYFQHNNRRHLSIILLTTLGSLVKRALKVIKKIATSKK